MKIIEYMRNLIPCIFLRYKYADIRVMLVSICGLVRIFVLRFVIPEVCTYGHSLGYEIGAWFIFHCLMSGGRGRAMVFSYQSIPLGACILVLCFDC